MIIAHICDNRGPHTLSDGYKSKYRLDTRPSANTRRSGYAQVTNEFVASKSWQRCWDGRLCAFCLLIGTENIGDGQVHIAFAAPLGLQLQIFLPYRSRSKIVTSATVSLPKLTSSLSIRAPKFSSVSHLMMLLLLLKCTTSINCYARPRPFIFIPDPIFCIF